MRNVPRTVTDGRGRTGPGRREPSADGLREPLRGLLVTLRRSVGPTGGGGERGDEVTTVLVDVPDPLPYLCSSPPVSLRV